MLILEAKKIRRVFVREQKWGNNGERLFVSQKRRYAIS